MPKNLQTIWFELPFGSSTSTFDFVTDDDKTKMFAEICSTFTVHVTFLDYMPVHYLLPLLFGGD